ncbi:competence protein ComK [Halalkalibacter akibai]|uniref:Competence protein n=1 Tax=Halalkalibacter akibai (strain ATCC 43226 / DSM 21942 / CIP 109018 / JCM 9157 / 1139) TaxID=1236973 RepID=W4QTR9_HALA3|nr:competence protein ComK [Halalkalibacter akibai]GAE34998.1 hypothetical protein JCM9157_2090 [Halalkalibacter akibai JCM 9157]
MTKPVVLPHYDLNRDTIALIPATHLDYSTIVWERNQILYVRKTPIQLIKSGCLEGGAEYSGRRTAVTYKTGIQNKIPIPINPHEQIYAFPTHSPKLFDCIWIFYHHIKTIKRHPQNPTNSIITFTNYQKLTLNVSYHTLEKQVQRTSYCIVRFSHHEQPNLCQLN